MIDTPMSIKSKTALTIALQLTRGRTAQDGSRPFVIIGAVHFKQPIFYLSVYMGSVSDPFFIIPLPAKDRESVVNTINSYASGSMADDL